VDHPLPWLRYLDADDLDDSDVDFDGMNVESASGEHLGDIDGFVVDSESGRPYYVVVAAGGWFRTKHFLLPVGHARLDANNQVLRADLTRDQVEKFPGFDTDQFDKLTPQDLKRLNDETCAACAIPGVSVAYAASESYDVAWARPDFRDPEWWRRSTPAAGRTSTMNPPSSVTSSSYGDRPPHETVVGRADTGTAGNPRAQPGDVIGIDTGGEQTHVGETAEDEDARRRKAERAANDKLKG
jgi:PRC-barrel domain protein